MAGCALINKQVYTQDHSEYSDYEIEQLNLFQGNTVLDNHVVSFHSGAALEILRNRKGSSPSSIKKGDSVCLNCRTELSCDHAVLPPTLSSKTQNANHQLT